MTIRIWDFGGQEVYRVTHQFFFSSRALYIVVWNPRQGREQNDVEGWLRRIRLRVGKGATVIIVATYGHERRVELDYFQLRDTFEGMLVGHHVVDNRSEMGIRALKEDIAIHAAALPQMGQKISKRWIDVRDEILSRSVSHPQILFTDFEEVCGKNQLTVSETRTLADLLHDLGQVIYYGSDDGLRDVMVLNPEWLTKAISRVLEDRSTRDASGVLDHARLADVWGPRDDEPGWGAHYHRYFLRLMEKFDVSYRLHDDENRSLVAQLVPYERPTNLPWTSSDPCPPGKRHLRLMCQLDDEAPGLIAWLTVRHHRASTGKHWRKGVFLRHPNPAYASEAFIELRPGNQLALDVRAPAPDLFFHVLRDSLEELIARRWPGLTYELLIPCSGQVNTVACAGQFPLHGLLSSRADGDQIHRCLRCGTRHDVTALLTGFAQAEPAWQPALEEFQAKLTNIVAGVDRAELFAADSAHLLRRVLKAVSVEVGDCPRLFTLAAAHQTWFGRWNKTVSPHHLTLWCEHPGHWHPWQPAAYVVQQPKAWFVTVRPYIVLLVKTLRLVVPIATAAAEAALPGYGGDATRQLSLMKAFVEAFPEEMRQEPAPVTTDYQGRLTMAEGGALRALRQALFDLDPGHQFGGLKRVQAPDGDFLWVCPDHHLEYDPGLPVLPQPRTPGQDPRSLKENL